MINLYLIFLVAIMSALSRKEYRAILLKMNALYLCQLLFAFNNAYIYQSAFIADFLVFTVAVQDKRRIALNISIISFLFMLSHIYGYLIYSLAIDHSSYDNLLTCLYIILIVSITRDGGVWNDAKGLVKYYLDDLIRRSRRNLVK